MTAREPIATKNGIMHLFACTLFRPSRVLLTSLALCIVTQIHAHPDKVERQLLTHFATGVHQPADGKWQDLSHKATAQIIGSPVWTNIGPAQAVLLNGVTDYLVISESPQAASEI